MCTKNAKTLGLADSAQTRFGFVRGWGWGKGLAKTFRNKFSSATGVNLLLAVGAEVYCQCCNTLVTSRWTHMFYNPVHMSMLAYHAAQSKQCPAPWW